MKIRRRFVWIGNNVLKSWLGNSEDKQEDSLKKNSQIEQLKTSIVYFDLTIPLAGATMKNIFSILIKMVLW